MFSYKKYKHLYDFIVVWLHCLLIVYYTGNESLSHEISSHCDTNDDRNLRNLSLTFSTIDSRIGYLLDQIKRTTEEAKHSILTERLSTANQEYKTMSFILGGALAITLSRVNSFNYKIVRCCNKHITQKLR